MRDGRDIVEIEGLDHRGRHASDPRETGHPRRPVAPEPSAGVRPWIGVFFRCCGVYARIYRAPDDPSYQGRCPRCRAEVRANVGPGGTSQRIFETQ